MRRPVEAAFATAAQVTRAHSGQQPHRDLSAGAAGGALGAYDPTQNRLTLTTPSQGVHGMRQQLAQVFGTPRKISSRSSRPMSAVPSAGGSLPTRSRSWCSGRRGDWAGRCAGGPGATNAFSPTARPGTTSAKRSWPWTEDGRFLAMKVRITANLGAYAIHYGPSVPTAFCCEVLERRLPPAGACMPKWSVFSQTRCRSILTAAPGARKGSICWNVWSMRRQGRTESARRSYDSRNLIAARRIALRDSDRPGN